ncbi:shikimate kinase family protein [Salix suchowensis]|nr:shikimate kinase family protein [Salix suchowensis]
MEITTATATATLAAAIPNLSLSSLSSTIKPRPRPHSHSRFSKFPIVSRPTSLTTICSLRNETATSTTKVAGDDTTLQVKKRAADLSPELKGTSIFILGMRGPIKTDLGKLLADALRYYYFDSDSLVEEAAGGDLLQNL